MARIHYITHFLMIGSFNSARIPTLLIKPQFNFENGGYHFKYPSSSKTGLKSNIFINKFK